MKQRESFLYYRLLWAVMTLYFIPTIMISAGIGIVAGLSLIPLLTLVIWQILALKYMIRNRGMAPWDLALMLFNIACLVGYFAMPLVRLITFIGS